MLVSLGAHLLSGAEPTSGPGVVSLPPLIVEEKDSPLRWRFLELPGLEVLSVCDDSSAEKFVRRIFEIDFRLQLILPDRFRVHLAVPEMHVLFNEKTGRAHSRELIAEMVKRNGASVGADGTIRLPAPRGQALFGRGEQRIRFLPNVRLTDLDAVAIFTILQESGDPSQFTFARDRIAFLLSRRAPALPEWFIEGMLELYPQIRFAEEEIEFRPLPWISEDETKALVDDPEWPRTLLPLAELFALARPTAKDPDPELERVWRSQAALFLRWALADKTGTRRNALWTWLDRLGTGPATEGDFRACFGLGFSETRDRLSDYLSSSVRQRETIPVPKPPPAPRLRFRAATDLEVARIRGDWERLQIGYVRAHYPSLTDTYIAQARRTLMRAYSAGQTDPRLMAVLGLTEYDAGNPALARGYLEAAVSGNVVRPRAYFELARLRLADLQGADANHRLSADAVRTVVTPLLRARENDPPLAEIYALMAEAWLQTDSPVPADDLAALAEGVRLFPAIPGLVVRAIQVHANNHAFTTAASFADSALVRIRDPRQRERLIRMRAELAKAGN